jgi:hypothetical protein
MKRAAPRVRSSIALRARRPDTSRGYAAGQVSYWASLASRPAWRAPARSAARSATAVIARAIPRRRHSGSVLTKITLAVASNAAEPDVARTTPTSSTAAHRPNAAGRDRRWSASARGSVIPGSPRLAAAAACSSATPSASSASRRTGRSARPPGSAAAGTVCRSRQIIAVAVHVYAANAASTSRASGGRRDDAVSIDGRAPKRPTNPQRGVRRRSSSSLWAACRGRHVAARTRP